MSSEGYHEPIELMRPETMDHHRAVISLMEEFEAIDWYDQRIDATDDEQLASILAHNRDEEKEHAAMVLEWLRRRDPLIDENLRTYLFTDGPIVDVEEKAMAAEGDATAAEPGTADGSLGIGSLRHIDLAFEMPIDGTRSIL